MQPYYTDLLSRAKTVSQQPYTPYNDPRLANFSPDTNKAFDLIRNTASTGGAGIDAAQATAGGIAGYNANPITTQGIPGANLQPYMDPYITNVLDVQKQRANQAFQEQQAGRDASAVQAGAFGGDRRFVSDSLAQRDLNQQLQGIDATGLSQAFNTATGLFQNDQTRNLQGQIANEDARRSGQALGLQAAQTQGTLSQARNDLNLQNAEALSGVGAKQQQREQGGLDIAYQDFLRQQNWPAQQLSLYSQLLSGTPVSPQTETSTTTPAPDFLSQLLGLATAGVGIAGLF